MVEIRHLADDLISVFHGVVYLAASTAVKVVQIFIGRLRSVIKLK